MATVRDDKVSETQNVNALASALVSSNLVDEFDLHWARRISTRKGQSLIDVLVDLELVSPQDIKQCMESLARLGRIKA